MILFGRILARMVDPAGDTKQYADALADGIEESLPRWVVRCVDRVHRAWAGPPPAEIMVRAVEAGRQAAADIGPRVRALLAADIDEQWTTPLALVREGVTYAGTVLAGAGVPEVERDQMDEAMFPADVYGLTPGSFADIDPQLGEAGVAWGAAKAWTHRRRHG
ncbi:MAG: hypothetical protein NVSMB4_17300 [Acidimicrobiales bacterium]